MMIKRSLIFIILILIFSTIQITQINYKKSINATSFVNKIKKQYVEKVEIKNIATLTIPKINLIRPLYSINDKRNNIEENVTILKESTIDHIILAAHSGNSKVSYFNDLDKLQIDDTIIINYQNNQEKTIILTTCSPSNDTMQLTIIGTKKY